MSSDLEADFAHGLRAVAESAAQPSPTDLYAGAVARGRRIRRTAVIKRTLAGAAALAVVAAVGLPLLHGASHPTAVDAAASPTTKAGPTADPKSKRPTERTPAGTAWMPAYMLRTLASLLPPGSDTSVPDIDGNDVPEAFAPTLASVSGGWAGMVTTGLTTSNGTASLSVIVRASDQRAHCPSRAEYPYEDCTTTSVNGGTLVLDLGFKNSLTGEGATIWDAYWYAPGGQEVTVDQVTDSPHQTTQPARQALTPQQMTALATSPAWARIWQSLPAPCPFGTMPGAANTKPAPGVGAGTGLVCATSRAVAIPTTPAS
jgi:hypothetical protein